MFPQCGILEVFPQCGILEVFPQCGILELFPQCGILEVFPQCGILEVFPQCGILELFPQCGILEVFPQCGILEVFPQCGIFCFYSISHIVSSLSIPIGFFSVNSYYDYEIRVLIVDWFYGFMVFSAIFRNISVISWRSVLMVEENGVPGENHRPAASH